jgi:hypothetical protein
LFYLTLNVWSLQEGMSGGEALLASGKATPQKLHPSRCTVGPLDSWWTPNVADNLQMTLVLAQSYGRY